MKIKRISFLLAFLLIAVLGFAQQQKVALQSNGETSFFAGASSFVDAYNAAQNGDTIYLSGGSFTSPNIFSKGLTIIGAGHYPDSTQATRKTFINGNVLLRFGSDNFYLEGVEITGALRLGDIAADIIENITIMRCKINGAAESGGTSTDRIAIIQSVLIGGLNLNKCSNVGVHNCILQAQIVNSEGNIIKNNVLLSNVNNNTGFGAAGIIHTSNNNLIENNVFIKDAASTVYGTGNYVSNNITVNPAPTWGTTPVTSGNYTVTRDDLFVNQSDNAFDYTHNYHLQSPETYLGTDGKTQVGIYGGTYPYKEGAVPSNPHISTKFVAPQTNSSGELQIEINVNAQDE